MLTDVGQKRSGCEALVNKIETGLTEGDIYVNITNRRHQDSANGPPVVIRKSFTKFERKYPTITHYCTVPLILDHSYLVGNLTNSIIAETNALEPPKSLHFCISNFQTC
jgi:hypothetical protein